jgi:hypothetical protein
MSLDSGQANSKLSWTVVFQNNFIKKVQKLDWAHSADLMSKAMLNKERLRKFAFICAQKQHRFSVCFTKRSLAPSPGWSGCPNSRASPLSPQRGKKRLDKKGLDSTAIGRPIAYHASLEDARAGAEQLVASMHTSLNIQVWIPVAPRLP